MTVPCFLDRRTARRRALSSTSPGSPDGMPVQGPSDTRRSPSPAASRASSLNGPIADRRAALALRARAARVRHRGRRRQRQRDGLRAPHDDVRDRLVRVRDPEHRQHPRDPPGPLALPAARRRLAAGLPQLPLPRPGDDPHRRASRTSRPSRTATGDPVIDTDELFYDGNSQGGILGGSLAAVAPDFERGGARRARHELLDPAAPQRRLRALRRGPVRRGDRGEAEDAICDQAADIPQADLSAAVVALCVAGVGTLPDDTPLGLYDNYPNELERPLILSLMQMLWDRGEANGYAHHMTTDPLREHPAARGPAPRRLRRPPGRERHRRGRGADDRRLGLPAGARPGPPLGGRRLETRSSASPRSASFPFTRLGARLLGRRPARLRRPGRRRHGPDGTATPPNGNIPPRPDDGFGADPHSYPRNDVKARAQKAAFLSPAGTVRNPCTTANNTAPPPLPIALDTGTPIPCYANGWTGPP